MDRSTLFVVATCISASQSGVAFANTGAQQIRAVVDRAAGVSRAAGRAFRGVAKLGDEKRRSGPYKLTAYTSEVGGKPHIQLLATDHSVGAGGEFASTVDSATVHGRTLSEYHVESSGRDGQEHRRGGWWTSQRNLLGPLLSVRTKTVLTSNGGEQPRVIANRRTLHVGKVPVLWLGRAMSPADIAQVGTAIVTPARE